MKECEKWLNRDGKDVLRPELRNWKGVCSEDGFKKGWRAALKWVLKHDSDIGIAICIRKELEEQYYE